MDKKLKRKWLTALRSGKFKQATSVLKSEEGYCCLGVLRHSINPLSRAQDKDGDLLCDRHLRVAGITDEVQKELANRNDGASQFLNHQHSFAEIADWIEKNL